MTGGGGAAPVTVQWRFYAWVGGGHGPPNRGQAPTLAVLSTHCGQLILGKISKFDATRCQILRLKCTKFDFCWGSAQNLHRGAYSVLPVSLAGHKGPTSKEREGRREGRGKGREVEEKGGEGKGEKIRGAPQNFFD